MEKSKSLVVFQATWTSVYVDDILILEYFSSVFNQSQPGLNPFSRVNLIWTHSSFTMILILARFIESLTFS